MKLVQGSQEVSRIKISECLYSHYFFLLFVIDCSWGLEEEKAMRVMAYFIFFPLPLQWP